MLEAAAAYEPTTPLRWLTESLESGFRYSILSSRKLSQFRSAYQEVEVHDSVSFGRVLRLDGALMTSEKDEFFYHENLVHVPACTHPSPVSALIIGGGDGGAAEELLKHNSITKVTLVEIDQAVLDMARQYLRGVHHGVIDVQGGDPRLQVVVADGWDYLRRSNEMFDLIILDLTDPIGAARPLYTPAFYQSCATHLNPGGALSLHIASPVAQPERVFNTLTNLCKAFHVVRPYLVSVPLSGGPWMMACASDSLDPSTQSPRHIDEVLVSRGISNLQYYNGHMHQAAMALPNYLRYAVASSGARCV